MASSAIKMVPRFDSNIKDHSYFMLILKPLDDALRCHICFEYFTNCMITKCSHNYCSVCIRRYMAYKSQCPTCFKVASEPELQNNRLIDEILRIYKKIRENFQMPCEILNEPVLEQPGSSKSVKKDLEEPSHTQASSEPPSKDKEPEAVQENSSSNEVSCPVCYKTVQNDRINIHLDSCLKQTEERNERKFLPKLVYHLLSDKEIRKKLKEHGLNTSGDRQTLIKRHKNFIILYNANCDSLEPKPVADLLLEIEKQELEEKALSCQKSTQINKKSDASEIEKQHELYVQEHQSQFNELIHDVQQRALGSTWIKQESDNQGSTWIKQESDNQDPVLKQEIVDSDSPDLLLKQTRPNFEDIEKVNFEKENISDPVYVKQEIVDSDSPDLLLKQTRPNFEDVKKVNFEKENTSDKKAPSTILLSSRSTKGAPTVKLKEESPSLLAKLSNQELLVADSQPSSLEDFEPAKITQMYRKRKNIRRLSTGEKGNQRKK